MNLYLAVPSFPDVASKDVQHRTCCWVRRNIEESSWRIEMEFQKSDSSVIAIHRPVVMRS